MATSDDFVYFDRPATAVEDNIALMNTRADAFTATANTAIAALGAFEVANDVADIANLPIPDVVIPSAVAPTAPSGTSFGSIPDLSEPSFEDVGASQGVDDTLLLTPAPFSSNAGQFSVPARPGTIDASGAPGSAPTITTPTLPSPLSIAAPGVPEFADIVLPASITITEPTLNDVEPSLTATEPTGIRFTESAYSSSTLSALTTKISTLMAGGTGMSPAVQDALFSAARAREDMTALAASQEAWDECGARGWSMPSGVLTKTLDATRERSRLNSNALERDLVAKAATWEQENIRFAVAQGMALESVLINNFQQAANRSFEMAKAQSDIELRLYDAALTVYRIRQDARQIGATIYRARWDGEIAKLQAHKADIDALAAKGQLNESRARVYVAQWEGIKASVDVYNGQLHGTEIQQETNKLAIESFAQTVSAYRETMAARKVPYEAWAEQMRGEAARGTMLEAESRAFAETVRAQESVANVKQRFIELKISGVRASVEKYVAKLTFQRDRVQAALSSIQATKEAFVADTGRYQVELAGVNQARSQEIAVQEMRLRSNISYHESQLREIDAALNRQIERSKVMLEALKATGQLSSTLTAGAMSAIHVSAAMHGSGSVSSSTSLSRTQKLPDLT